MEGIRDGIVYWNGKNCLILLIRPTKCLEFCCTSLTLSAIYSVNFYYDEVNKRSLLSSDAFTKFWVRYIINKKSYLTWLNSHMLIFEVWPAWSMALMSIYTEKICAWKFHALYLISRKCIKFLKVSYTVQ